MPNRRVRRKYGTPPPAPAKSGGVGAVLAALLLVAVFVWRTRVLRDFPPGAEYAVFLALGFGVLIIGAVTWLARKR